MKLLSSIFKGNYVSTVNNDGRFKAILFWNIVLITLSSMFKKIPISADFPVVRVVDIILLTKLEFMINSLFVCFSLVPNN
jgi:hypothetical protein